MIFFFFMVKHFLNPLQYFLMFYNVRTSALQNSLSQRRVMQLQTVRGYLCKFNLEGSSL